MPSCRFGPCLTAFLLPSPSHSSSPQASALPSCECLHVRGPTASVGVSHSALRCHEAPIAPAASMVLAFPCLICLSALDYLSHSPCVRAPAPEAPAVPAA